MNTVLSDFFDFLISEGFFSKKRTFDDKVPTIEGPAIEWTDSFRNRYVIDFYDDHLRFHINAFIYWQIHRPDNIPDWKVFLLNLSRSNLSHFETLYK